MAIKKRFEIKKRQKLKRRKRRRIFKKKGINPDEVYSSGIYIGSSRSK